MNMKRCNCGCGHAHSMREAAELLRKALIEKFGDQVSFRYVDVFSEEDHGFPRCDKGDKPVPPTSDGFERGTQVSWWPVFREDICCCS